LTQIASYDGVEEDEVFITTKLAYYQEWLKREINKRLGSEAVATTRTRKYLVKEIRNKKTNGGEKNMMIAKPVSR
jgi:hypothetical protein